MVSNGRYGPFPSPIIDWESLFVSIISKKKCAGLFGSHSGEYVCPYSGLDSGLGSMDKALYDLLLGLKEPPPVSDRLVLLDVDDIAIEKVGGWPWPRSLMADGLLT